MKNLPFTGFGLIAFGATMIFGTIVPMIASSLSAATYSYGMMGGSGFNMIGMMIGLFALVMFLVGMVSCVAGILVILTKKAE